MKIVFARPEMPTTGALVVPVLEGKVLPTTAAEADRLTGGAVSRAMNNGRFEGKKDQTLTLIAPSGMGISRLMLIGVGKAKEIDDLRMQGFGGLAIAQLQSSGETGAMIAVDALPDSPLAPGDSAANIAFGARLRSYRFDKYRTKEKKEEKPSLRKLSVLVEDLTEARKAYEPLDAAAQGVEFTRDLVSEPANVIYPESLAEKAKELSEIGVEIEILGEKEMKKLGMGALLGVGQGSKRDSQLVIMRWNGGEAEQKPVAFVGKGVTFDSGGISIKPSGGMEEMKWDMAGAGAVIGAMRAIAARKAKCNVVGIVGLVENMPSGAAQRPGDVVRSMSGQTIEVINTDAEGRLVLADALWYCQDRFKPSLMIDLATLTGAIIIALGYEYAGLFASDDKLAENIAAAGKAVAEPVWRLPMGEAYDKMINSDIADMKNTGDGRSAGSITGAQFVKRFVNNVPWAHIDIAAVAWAKKDGPVTPKGATAYGVRLLDRFIRDFHEVK
jgi:leucyl aminopeptidase